MKQIEVVIWWPTGQGDFNIGVIERGICRFSPGPLPSSLCLLITARVKKQTNKNMHFSSEPELQLGCLSYDSWSCKSAKHTPEKTSNFILKVFRTEKNYTSIGHEGWLISSRPQLEVVQINQYYWIEAIVPVVLWAGVCPGEETFLMPASFFSPVTISGNLEDWNDVHKKNSTERIMLFRWDHPGLVVPPCHSMKSTWDWLFGDQISWKIV